MQNPKLHLKKQSLSLGVFYFLLVTYYFLASTAFAATGVITIDTGGEEINALESTIVLPEGMHVSRIETGNSAILFWIEAPKLVGNTITFSGITPGGFSGVGEIFTINGVFDDEELQNAYFENSTSLKNDGVGELTPVRLLIKMTSFRHDSVPPEDFIPTVINDSNVFGGKYFLVFATQDKGSGVKSYEVREGRIGFWTEAKSPHLLVRQSLDKDIYVKAIDNSGNERVAVVLATVHKEWWGALGLFAILMIVVIVVRRRMGKKRKKKILSGK